MKLEVFIQANATCDAGTLAIYLREARRLAGWLGSRVLNVCLALWRPMEKRLAGLSRGNLCPTTYAPLWRRFSPGPMP